MGKIVQLFYEILTNGVNQLLGDLNGLEWATIKRLHLKQVVQNRSDSKWSIFDKAIFWRNEKKDTNTSAAFHWDIWLNLQL